MVTTFLYRFRLLAAAGILMVLSAAPAAAAGLPDIRVVLSDSGTQATVSGELAWYADGREIGWTGSQAAVQLSGGQPEVKIKGKTHRASRLSAVPTRGSVSISNRDYRGRFEFFKGREGGLIILNVLPLEDYLCGVVAAEMPPAWDPQALRAQAIAARTYAISRMVAKKNDTYDVYSTVSDQAYKGIAGEDPRTNQAVADTTGMILTYQGAPIVAYFCADAGGCTRTGTQPYLVSKPSSHPLSPHNGWTIELSLDELAALVSREGGNIGRITGLRAEHSPVSGHLEHLIVRGERGEFRLAGTTLRKHLGYNVMKSTLATVTPIGLKSTPVVRHAVPATTGQPSGLETVPMEGWRKPWVDNGVQPRDLKMRTLYAFNGHDLKRCSQEVHLFAGRSGIAAPQAASNPTVEYDIDSFTPGVSISGSGYGHGLGMSQWGARALAEEGMDYRRILEYFYTGVELVKWNGSLPEPVPSNGDTQGFYQPFKPK